MAEGPAGTYTADFSIPFTGPAVVSITIDCPEGTDDETTEFNIYIDPSGFVRDTNGAPIEGATVKLYRSDSSAGPFELVPDGSAIMSPSNRANPDITDEEDPDTPAEEAGHFGWDVIAGFYKVTAEKTDCHAPGDESQAVVESRIMEIPPPVTDLDLRLDCPTLNTAPVANNDPENAEDPAYTTEEDVELTLPAPGVLANDTDEDNDQLTVKDANANLDGLQPASAPSHGTLNLNADGSFSYTPDEDYSGTDTFTYKATDGEAESADAATVTITVDPVNDTPGFRKGQDQTTPEDSGPQSVPNWATGISPGPDDEATQDVDFIVTSDNEALFTDSGKPKLSSSGELTYESALHKNGAAIVTVKARDDGGGDADTSAPQTFTITVSEVNDRPEAINDAKTVTEDSGATPINVLANDKKGPDGAGEGGQALTISSVDGIVTGPSHGTATVNNDGTISYTPNENYTGPDSFEYKVCDDGTTAGAPDPKCDEGAVEVTIEAANDRPTISEITDKTINENESTGPISFTIGDLDGDGLTVSGASSNQNLVPDANIVIAGTGGNRTVTVTPAPDKSGTAKITLTVDDGSGAQNSTAQEDFLLTVNDVPNPDTTAPEVVEVTPKDRAKKVSRKTDVTAVFSEKVSNVDRGTFKLFKQQGRRFEQVSATVRPGPDGSNSFILDPNRDLSPGTYTAVITGGTNGVRDLADNPLRANKTWTFKVSGGDNPKGGDDDD
jgi:VCBS repeat-containing protein